MALTIHTDHLVVGSGIAGLMLAHKLGQKHKVVIIAKESLSENNSRYAQGGIASVLSPEDSFDKHITDTLEAGAGLCHPDIVEEVVKAGPEAIRELIELGVKFTHLNEGDKDDPRYHLTLEGGHSARRIIHADDLTGAEVVRALGEAIKKNPNIMIYENMFAIDLITSDKVRPDFKQNFCLGAYVFKRDTREIYQIRSKATHLCAGGHGKVYLYTSNPDVATGDGLAMGWRAGCKVANLEFMQFHPTCLYSQKEKTFLISEAVRGEGAILKTAEGRPFMQDYHPLESLAPRDIVARAIDSEIKKSSVPYVYLDARGIGEARIKERFPNIYKVCLAQGIDMSKEMLPVVPAAHFSCGGLVTDDWGHTSVTNLFAIGEVACTGLHGANRLASNSLLEAVVFAKRVAAFVEKEGLVPAPEVPDAPWRSTASIEPDEVVVLTHTWDEIRRMMWNYVGIVRSDKRLQRAYTKITAIRQELESFYWDNQIDVSLLEVRNLADVAFLTIRCALKRKESRGIHFTIDYPKTAEQPVDTVIW